jgi:hypothetical protein
MPQIRTVTNLSSLRITLNVLLSAFYLLSVCQSSSAGESLSGMLAAQAVTAPSSPETAANRARLAEGEYKVLTEYAQCCILRKQTGRGILLNRRLCCAKILSVTRVAAVR